MSPPLTKEPDLRVLMTADAVGGVWQYAIDLAAGLRPHGIAITLAVLGPSPSADQRAAAEASGVSLVPLDLPLDWTARTPGEVEEAGKAVARLTEEVKPDILHLNSPALAAGASFPCPVVAVCHSCVATWWQAVRSGPLPDEFVWRTDLVRQGYRAADVLIAPTEAFADVTARAYGLEKRPVVIHNGRRPAPRGEAESAGLFAFTAGRLWDDGKNLAAIDRAAAGLPLPFVAAGPLQGPHGAGIELHHVKAVGRIGDADIARYLRAAPIFVSAAYYEPFGLAVLEAAQAGCALVLSDIPTFRELWNDAAVFVPPDDDRAIADAVMRLAKDGAARARSGSLAKERAAAYSLEAMSRGILAVYESLLRPRARRSSIAGAAA